LIRSPTTRFIAGTLGSLAMLNSAAGLENHLVIESPALHDLNPRLALSAYAIVGKPAPPVQSEPAARRFPENPADRQKH